MALNTNLIQQAAANRAASGASTRNTALSPIIAPKAPQISPTVKPSQSLQQVKPLPALNTSTAKPAQSTTTAKPLVSSTATPQQKALATVSTAKGVSPRSAFSTDAAYQAYQTRAGGAGTQYTPETNPEAFPVVNKTATPTKPATQPAQATPPVSPTASTDNVQSESDQILSDSKQSLDELNKLKEAQISGEGGEQDAIVQAANDRYNAEQANAKRMEDLQKKVLDDKNLAVTSSSEIQRTDAQIADDQIRQELQLQRERTQQAFNDQIVEQKVQNTQRTLQKESMLAALGGYGSLVKNNELQNLTIENDRLMNDLVFKKDESDKEVTFKLTNEINTYQQNLKKIEVDKNTAVTENYDKYLEYIDKIQGDREMSEVNKQEAITKAAAAYKKNVAKINQDSFEKRYEISQTAAKNARDIKNQERDDARAVMKDILNTWAFSDEDLTPAQQKALNELEKMSGYPIGISLQNLKNLKAQAKAANLDIRESVNDSGDVTYAAIDKTTGKVVTYETLSGLGKSATSRSSSGEKDPYTGLPIEGGSSSGGVSGGGKYDVVSSGDGIKVNVQVGDKAGQCGRFVNDYLGMPSFMKDSFSDKMAKTDPSITVPSAGMVFVMPIKGLYTGHTGVVESVDMDKQVAWVVDSNWRKDEKISRHAIPLSHISGYVLPPKGKSVGNSDSSGNSDTITPQSAYKEAVKRGLTGNKADDFVKTSVRAGIYPPIGGEIKGNKLPATASQRLSDGKSAINVLDSIEGIINNGGTNPFNVAGTYNPWNTTIQTNQAAIKRATQLVGKYMEGGVLRKEDEEKYKAMLPNITDTPEVAKNKLEGVRQMLLDKYKTDLNSYKNSSYEVGDYEFELNNNSKNTSYSSNSNNAAFDNPTVKFSLFMASHPESISQIMKALKQGWSHEEILSQYN